MRCSRLILEAGPNAVTVRFHPQLTVVAGVGRLERDCLGGELLSALGAGREGAHLEVVDDRGRRLAFIRKGGSTPDRVVDLDTRSDVSEEFRTTDGRIDLLASLSVSRADARRRLRLRASDLRSTAGRDEAVERLAHVPGDVLWPAATELAQATAWLSSEADRLGADLESAEVVEEIEQRHREFEGAQSRHESIRHLGIFVGGACALGAVPAALLQRWAALPFLAVALVTTLVSIHYRRRMHRARKAEATALAAAGAESYLGFHLQRMDAMLADQEQRGRFSDAAEHQRSALERWRSIAGDADVDWALASRAGIEARSAGGAPVHAIVPAGRPADVADALKARLAELEQGGKGGESLPLLLDEAFAGLEGLEVWELLEILRTASAGQAIYLTEDPEVAAWARATAAGGSLSVIEPAPESDAVEAGRRDDHDQHGSTSVRVA